MNQLCLVLPLARRTDPATSHAAANKAASITPSQRNIIAAALSTPGTVKAISDRCGLSQYAVSKRLPELAQLGVIELTGEVIDGCRVWRKS